MAGGEGEEGEDEGEGEKKSAATSRASQLHGMSLPSQHDAGTAQFGIARRRKP